MESYITYFYGTEIYMKINNNEDPNIIAEYNNDNIRVHEKCIFDINTCSIISGNFSNPERYEDVKEWILLNKSKLIEMWNTGKIYELEGLE